MATTRTQSSTPTRRPRAGQGPAVAPYDFFLLGVVSILVGLGLVMIFISSFDQSNRFFDRPTYYFLRQLQWLVVSVVFMLSIALVDFRILKRWALVIMIGTVLLLLVVLVFGHDNLGARRHLLNNSVQPSEVAKLTIIIYIAYWLSSKGSRLKEVSYGLVPFAVLLGLVALLVVSVWLGARSAPALLLLPPLVLLAITHLTVILTRYQPATEGAISADVHSKVPLIGVPAIVAPPEHEPLAILVQDHLWASEAVLDGWTGREVAGALRSGGWSNKKIARYLEVHPSTVGRWFAHDTDQRGEKAGGSPEAEPMAHPVDATSTESEEEAS